MKKKKKKKPLLSMTNELYSSIAKPMKYRVKKKIKKKIVPISYLLDFFFLLKAKVKFSLSLSLHFL